MKKKMTWPDHVSQWPQSGMSKKAYCLKYGLSYPLFFYYQKQVVHGAGPSGFEQVVLHDQYSVTPTRLKVEFSNGAVMIFPEHLLERVIDLINNRGTC
jgi:hypothetical protein